MNETATPGSFEELDSDYVTVTTNGAGGSPPRSSFPKRFAGFLFRGMPTVLVLALLIGIAYFGHRNDWKLPKFSELTTVGTASGQVWCEAHGVPEKDCIACHSSLMPKNTLYGWCAEHGVHECVLHHPELAQLKERWEPEEYDFDRATRAIDVRPRTRNDPECKMHLRRIQFPSNDAAKRAGIGIETVQRGPIVESLKVSGEVVYDPTRIAQVSPRTEGTIWQVRGNIGDVVRKGEILAIVDAVEVGRAKSNLLEELVELKLAGLTHERLEKLRSGNAVSEQELQRAEAAKSACEVLVANAAQRLSNLGLPIDEFDYLNRPVDDVRKDLRSLGIPEILQDKIANPSSNLLPVFASRDGVIASRNAVAGEVVRAGQTIFTVVDTNRMWLLLNVPLEETARVQLGQTIVFSHDGTGEQSEGRVAWISTEADAQTRTVEIRGELANADGRLKNETYGLGEIVLRVEADAIVVSDSAIHWEGCCNVAFVRDRDYFRKGSYKVFHTRSVRPGVMTRAGHTEIIAGLLPGEEVVTTGSGMLRAELLKGNLGAG